MVMEKNDLILSDSNLPSRIEVTDFLKKFLSRELPADLVHRPKAGFGIPIDGWFRQELGAFAKDHVLSSEAISRGYFRRSALERVFEEHSSGRFNHGFKLWNLLMLELWHRWVAAVPEGVAA